MSDKPFEYASTLSMVQPGDGYLESPFPPSAQHGAWELVTSTMSPCPFVLGRFHVVHSWRRPKS